MVSNFAADFELNIRYGMIESAMVDANKEWEEANASSRKQMMC